MQLAPTNRLRHTRPTRQALIWRVLAQNAPGSSRRGGSVDFDHGDDDGWRVKLAKAAACGVLDRYGPGMPRSR
jgi:hypothetical protein